MTDCEILKCEVDVLDICKVCGGSLTRTTHKVQDLWNAPPSLRGTLSHLSPSTGYAKNCTGEYHKFEPTKSRREEP